MLRSTWSKCAIVTACLLSGAILSAPAHAITAYTIPAPVAGNQNFGGPLGMDFNLTQSIKITDLGVFDSNADGLSLSLKAYIYDRNNSAAPLRTVNFATGPTGTLTGSQRFLPLGSPLYLPAGFQGSIVADGYGNTELNGNGGGGGGFGGMVLNGGGAMSFVGASRYGFTPGLFPTNTDSNPAQYGAGTFNYNVTAAAGPIAFVNATGSSEQPGSPFGGTFNIDKAVDGVTVVSGGNSDGWALGGSGGDGSASSNATFETAQDIDFATGNALTFKIISGGYGNHTVGLFRLSVTSADRSLFADGNNAGGAVVGNEPGVTWTVLNPTSVSALGLAETGVNTLTPNGNDPTLTIQGDGSILASGNDPGFAQYTINAMSLGAVTGVRLELIDANGASGATVLGLPNGGPGRAGNGNLVVLEFSLSASAAIVPEPASASLLVLGAIGLLARRKHRVA